MPIYEYVCDPCGHHLESLQKISEAPLIYCPECGEATLRKKVSAAAFRLKGGGWYETDFKSGGKKKNLAGDSGGTSGGDKSGGEKSSTPSSSSSAGSS